MSILNKSLLSVVILFSLPIYAAEKPQSAKKQTTAANYLTAQEAYNLKQQQGKNLLFVDIRTPSELVFVGSPENLDINIPFLTIDYKQWNEKKNLHLRRCLTSNSYQVSATLLAQKILQKTVQ